MRQVGVPRKVADLLGPWDAIVVGSGPGGLASAALLARHAGWRVLVLERHYVAGGFTHVFRRPGYEWDVGLHYLGDLGADTLTRRLFDHLGEGRLRWAPMGDVYDRIVVAGEAYDLAATPQAFAAGLKARFPREAAGIDRYLARVRQAAGSAGLFFAEKALPAALSAVAGGLLRRRFLAHARRTTGEVLAELVSDARLRAVLAGQYGDYGLAPGRSSFGMHALLVRHYLWGGFYPVGGASTIAAAIAPGIEAAGGRIVLDAEVESILVEGARAVGVRLRGGPELRARVVISNAGVRATFGRLLPADAPGHADRDALLQRLPASVGHLCLYLGLRHTAEELGLPRHNIWIYPGDDHDQSLAAFLRDPEAPLPLLYVSFPSAKDPSFAQRYPGRATIEVITVAPWERFAAWADRRWRRRGEDYERLKRRLTERMLDGLFTQLPQIRGRIDVAEASTPLSTRHFTGYAQGEIYGVEHSPARFAERALRPRTGVPGLFLTGQDVMTCGVAGGLFSGALTASAILRRNLVTSLRA